jgi:biopolymer transport protein TolQ
MMAFVASILPTIVPALQAQEVVPLPSPDAAVAADLPHVASGKLDIFALLLHASLPVQLVMVLLLLASLASWVIILRKKRVFDRATRELERFEESFWSGTADLPRLYATATERHRTAEGMESVFEAGWREFSRLRQGRRADPQLQLDTAQRAMRVTVSRELDSLEQNLEFLANVGSISPYVGLFGTVWGIMVSFQGLANVREATIATVAPGISEALVATAMGLFAAIPAVWAYNRFASRVERIATRYDAFAEEFFSILQRQAQHDAG